MTDEQEGMQPEDRVSAPVNEREPEEAAPEAELSTRQDEEIPAEVLAAEPEQIAAQEMLDEGAPVADEDKMLVEAADQQTEADARFDDAESLAEEVVTEEPVADLSTGDVEKDTVVMEVQKKAPTRERVEDSA